MGRPKKRQRADEEQSEQPKVTSSPPLLIQAQDLDQDRKLAPDMDPDQALSSSEGTSYASGARAASFAPSASADVPLALRNSLILDSEANTTITEFGASRDMTMVEPQYPLSVADWPDFSRAEPPWSVEDQWRRLSPTLIDPDADFEALSNLPAAPACPCLPNLYLNLSSVAGLPPFCFNHQTLATIEAAYRAAKAVIYCSICPQQFNTGSQNLMLACTLLNVLADRWSRLGKLGILEIMRGFVPADQIQQPPTTKQGAEWRDFVHHLMRAYVFGDETIPPLPSTVVASHSTSGSYPEITLMGLAEALMRRQRQWHRLDEATDEFPDRVTPDLTSGHIVGAGASDSEGKFLCIEIVTHAMCIIKALNKSGPVVQRSTKQ